MDHKIQRRPVGSDEAMDHGPGHAYMGGMNIGTRIFTWLKGVRVGQDASGNVYYTERHPGAGTRARRWVAYDGTPEASRVPAEWHAWLHYTTNAALPEQGKRPWQKPHVPNLTGTPAGYRPAGHDYQGGQRAAATGDYEAWTPGS